MRKKHFIFLLFLQPGFFISPSILFLSLSFPLSSDIIYKNSQEGPVSDNGAHEGKGKHTRTKTMGRPRAIDQVIQRRVKNGHKARRQSGAPILSPPSCTFTHAIHNELSVDDT